MKPEEKVALITGAGGGTGLVMSLLFAKGSYDIGVNDIDLSLAEETAAAVKQIGRRAIGIKADVSEPDDTIRWWIGLRKS